MKQYEVDGSLYKIGVHGKVFRWDGVEWVLSSKTVKQLQRAIRRDAKQQEIRGY